MSATDLVEVASPCSTLMVRPKRGAGPAAVGGGGEGGGERGVVEGVSGDGAVRGGGLGGAAGAVVGDGGDVSVGAGLLGESQEGPPAEGCRRCWKVR